jgi:CubicO group peptidase (beta-lactamase class C family)
MTTQPGTPGPLAAQIEAALRQARIPGCSIVLVDRSGPVWSGGFGFADLGTRRPAAPDTVYHLFSGTKLFTATAVLQLAEHGALALNDPAVGLLPELTPAPGVTLRHLLSHQSGLKDTLRGFLAVSFPPAAPPNASEALARYRIAPSRPPGRRVEYRNVNYALLGVAVSRAAGIEYRDYVTRHVLGPLGAKLAFSLTADMRPRAATGYVGRWDPMRVALRLILPDVARALPRERVDGLVALREYDLATAAIGGLVGPMPEFARFLVAQLGDGGGVLTAESTRRMQALVARGRPGVRSRVGIGLGWKHGRVEGHAFLNHEGGGAGFTTELWLYPEAGVGVALGMNAMRMPATMHVAHALSEAVFAARRELGG